MTKEEQKVWAATYVAVLILNKSMAASGQVQYSAEGCRSGAAQEANAAVANFKFANKDAGKP